MSTVIVYFILLAVLSLGACRSQGGSPLPVPPMINVSVDPLVSGSIPADITLEIRQVAPFDQRIQPSSISLDWGDGTPIEVITDHEVWHQSTGDLGSYVHTFLSEGTFSVSVRVESNLGLFTDAITVRIGA